MAIFMKYVSSRQLRENQILTLYYRYHAGNDLGFLWIENGRNNIKFKFSSRNVVPDKYGRESIQIRSPRYSMIITKNVFDGECVFKDKEAPEQNMTLHLNTIPPELFKLRM